MTRFEPKLSPRRERREDPFQPYARPEKAARQVGKKLVSVSLAQLRFLGQLARGRACPVRTHNTPTHRALARKGCVTELFGRWALTPDGAEMRAARGKLWIAA